MQYHASLITADGAYHCPVGSIMAILLIFGARFELSLFKCTYSHRLLVVGMILAPSSRCSVPGSFEDETLLICISGQRESFFQSRDENESFSDSISFIETRPRIPDTYSQASRRDREKISSNLEHRDEIEIYYLHSQTSRREREFP